MHNFISITFLVLALDQGKYGCKPSATKAPKMRVEEKGILEIKMV